jgi:hypothetical protein
MVKAKRLASEASRERVCRMVVKEMRIRVNSVCS